MKASYLAFSLSAPLLFFSLNTIANNYASCSLSYNRSDSRANAAAPASESACFMAPPSTLPSHGLPIQEGGPASCTIENTDPLAYGHPAHNVLRCTTQSSPKNTWFFYCHPGNDDSGHFSTPYWSKGTGGFNCAFLHKN